MIPVPLELFPQIQNIVATVNLGCKLDLKQIACSTKNAQYNPQRFAAVIMRLRQPRSTSLIFSSGKMVVTGTKNQQDSRLAAKKAARIIQRLSFPVKVTEFTVQNMVGSCDVKFAINLQKFQSTCKDKGSIQYQSQIFPGLIFRNKNLKEVLIIFVSGKIVLTGAKTQLQIQQAFKSIYPLVWQCSKTAQRN